MKAESGQGHAVSMLCVGFLECMVQKTKEKAASMARKSRRVVIR